MIAWRLGFTLVHAASKREAEAVGMAMASVNAGLRLVYVQSQASYEVSRSERFGRRRRVEGSGNNDAEDDGA